MLKCAHLANGRETRWSLVQLCYFLFVVSCKFTTTHSFYETFIALRTIIKHTLFSAHFLSFSSGFCFTACFSHQKCSKTSARFQLKYLIRLHCRFTLIVAWCVDVTGNKLINWCTLDLAMNFFLMKFIFCFNCRFYP